VTIIEESQYQPVTLPVEIEINSYMDDFPGALIRRVKASDHDPYDTLTYELVPTYNPYGGPPQSHLFKIDHGNGKIVALQGLDIGSYPLNISVSDGKFTTFIQCRVNVRLITEEILDHGVIARFANTSPEEFVANYMKPFIKVVKTIMNVRSKIIYCKIYLNNMQNIWKIFSKI
jgi:protocadherin Fat 1/2/3